MVKVFSNSLWIKSSLENCRISQIEHPSSYFRANVLTVRPNAANHMALESLRKCETFCYILFLPNPYDFKLILKMAKKIARNFYKLYRNEADNIPLKSYGKCKKIYVDGFLRFLDVFK